MLLNSVHEQCPNSDPKQCTFKKLGWVHSGHTQNPGRAHTAHAVPMSWALLRAQQAGRAHVACTASAGRAHVACTASAGRAHAGRALVATRPGNLPPGRDLTSMSRHQGSQNHVATSNRCRDTTQNTPGRDLKTGSRHQTSCCQSTQVATSISCRDLTLTRPGCDLKSCSDLKSFSPGHQMNFMSRPRTLQS